jgi:hypothetical protein
MDSFEVGEETARSIILCYISKFDKGKKGMTYENYKNGMFRVFIVLLYFSHNITQNFDH